MASFQQPTDKRRLKMDKKMSRISKIMRGQNLDAVLELESLQEEPLGLKEIAELELPTGPVRPIDPKFLSPIEQLEALASLELKEIKPDENQA
jgi:hypothetical protein